MDSKSHDSDELTLLINKVEILTKRLEKTEDLLKKNTDSVNNNTIAQQNLKDAVVDSNKMFEKVSDGIKELYDKVKGLELLSKLAGSVNFGSLLGGLGSSQKK